MKTYIARIHYMGLRPEDGPETAFPKFAASSLTAAKKAAKEVAKQYPHGRVVEVYEET